MTLIDHQFGKSLLSIYFVNIKSSLSFSKRARYDVALSDTNRWTLSKNELILHSVYDSGVERLASDSEYALEKELKRQNVMCGTSVETSTTKAEQIAVLEAALPENTLKKLTMGELDHIMIQEEKKMFNNSNTSRGLDLIEAPNN